MSKEPVVDIAEVFRLGTPIDEAMNEAVRIVVERHRQSGLPLVVWKDGRVVEISPDALPPSAPNPDAPSRS
jgi:monomeric isocitrate dehydrogenase